MYEQSVIVFHGFWSWNSHLTVQEPWKKWMCQYKMAEQVGWILESVAHNGEENPSFAIGIFRRGDEKSR